MSWMGNTFMPGVEAIAKKAAYAWVDEWSNMAFTQGVPLDAPFWKCDESWHTPDEVKEYLMQAINEELEDYEPINEIDYGVSWSVFHTLAYAMASVMEGDW